MEARIARIESDVAHLQTDVGDIKVDLRALRDKVDGMDTRLTDKIDAQGVRLTDRIDALDVRLTESITSARNWGIGLYIALSGAMLGTMARGFGWI